jgi:hypothetical protein
MIYLAEKADRLPPTDSERCGKVLEQLFFHASGLSRIPDAPRDATFGISHALALSQI